MLPWQQLKDLALQQRCLFHYGGTVSSTAYPTRAGLLFRLTWYTSTTGTLYYPDDQIDPWFKYKRSLGDNTPFTCRLTPRWFERTTRCLEPFYSARRRPFLGLHRRLSPGPCRQAWWNKAQPRVLTEKQAHVDELSLEQHRPRWCLSGCLRWHTFGTRRRGLLLP